MKKVLFILMCMFTPVLSFGQDADVVEALIINHKTESSLLALSNTLEMGNAALHKTLASTTLDYKNVNVNLEKYTKAFDVIDLVLQSVKTGYSAVRTTSAITSRVSDFKDMLVDYTTILNKKGFYPSDTLIINRSQAMLNDVSGNVQDIYDSIMQLCGFFVLHKYQLKTTDITSIMVDIDQSLRDMRYNINSSYYEIWNYIQLRKSYFKGSVMKAITKEVACTEALSRWKARSNPNFNK